MALRESAGERRSRASMIRQMRGNRKLAPLRVAQLRRTSGGVVTVQLGHGSGKQAVARAQGQAMVKTGVKVAVFLTGQQAALLVAGDDLQLVELFGAVAQGGQLGNGGFKDSAEFHDFVEHQVFRTTASRMAFLRGSMSGART